MFDRLPFTFPFNLTGHPAASVPCGFTSDGLPAALQIVGRLHADTLVLQAAAAFEQALPQMLQAAPALRASETYRYDLVDIARQTLANESRVLLPRIGAAYGQADRPRFEALSRC